MPAGVPAPGPGHASALNPASRQFGQTERCGSHGPGSIEAGAQAIVSPATREFLAWIAYRPRTYAEAMDAWLGRIWLQCVSDAEQDRLDGYGLAMVGVWEDGK